jgi:hypothetical protein
MRRSFLFVGIAALAVGIGVTAYATSNNKEREREHHIVVVYDNALCEKSLEMAASFSSYNRQARMAETLENTNSYLTQALEKDLRKEAYDLGFSQYEYDAILLKARTDAEKALIPQINGAKDPAAKALEIAQMCMPWPLDSHIN